MIDGLWSVEFFVPPSGTAVYGSGVVVFNNGSIRGGDSSYYYKGNYQILNGQFNANVSIIHYSGAYDNVQGEGIKQTDLSLTGNPDSNEFEISGSSPALKKPISARLERLSDL